MTYALISTATPGPVIKRGEYTDLSPQKMFKWIPDNPPTYDPATQTRTESASVPVDAAEVPYTVADISLADLRATRKAELAAKRYAVEVGGVTVGGVTVDTQRDSQAMIAGAKQSLDAGLISAPINWKTEAGFVQIDSATLNAIAGAVAVHVQSCFSNEANISEAIDAATTADDILAVDLTSGWPS